MGPDLDDAPLVHHGHPLGLPGRRRRWLTISAILPAVIRLRVIRMPCSALASRAAVMVREKRRIRCILRYWCLLREDLLDELQLFVHPVLIGGGKRLFEEGEERKALELVDSKAFSTGVVYLTHRPTRG